MSVEIRHEEDTYFGFTQHSATLTIGALSMAGRSKTRALALRELLTTARIYQRSIEVAVEAIEAEIKEVGE